jgi:succinate dehydrogenase/fumarate reductase flavoprotein subunit
LKNGSEDENGWSGVAGMWGAGDGLASCMCGSAYVCMGASSNASCLQGRMAAEDACKYVDTAPAANPSAGAIKALTDVLLKPMQSPVGFTPDWAEEVLCNIMAPYWVAYMKDETTLTAALHQVMMLQKKVIGNLRARSGHELRYCHEMVNKALNCEMKLRAGLFRTESRGMHYRYDYPFRDDDNWLAFVCIKKGANGEMELYKEPMNPEWCGDRSIPYLERYPRRFPNEPLGL